MSGDSASGFGRRVSVGDLPPGGQVVDLEFPSAICADIADRIDLLGLAALSLTGQLTRSGKVEAHFEGRIEATVTQSCVVTLEPVEQTVSEAFQVHFVPPETLEEYDEPELYPDDVDIEPLVDGGVDLGELAIQYLAVSLDPYPRSAGATKTLEDAGIRDSSVEEGDVSRENPFAVLRKLKDNA